MDTKIVKTPVWDLDTDEIVKLEIDQESLDAMDEASEKYKLRRKEARVEEHRMQRYDRNND